MLGVSDLSGTPRRACRVCGCTDLNACVDRVRGPCAWVAIDLCSHCEVKGGSPTTNARLAAAVATVLLRHAEWDAAETAFPDDDDEIGDHVDVTLCALDDALESLKSIFEQEFPHV